MKIVDPFALVPAIYNTSDEDFNWITVSVLKIVNFFGDQFLNGKKSTKFQLR